MPKYKVVAHRRVLRFLNSLDDERQRKALVEAMERLEGYPVSLREMDVASIRGGDRRSGSGSVGTGSYSRLIRVRIRYW